MTSPARAARRPSDRWLLDLAAHASTIDQRIDGEFELTPADAETTSRRLSAWSDAVAKGDAAEFAVRLALDGLDRDAAARVVGHAAPRAGASVPEWARLVGDAIAESAQRSSLSDDPALVSGDPIPAQELALPFLRAAQAERERRAAPFSQLADDVLIAEDRYLLRKLAVALEGIWDRELAVMRDREFGPLAEHVFRARGWTGREHYDRLARGILGELADFLERFPSLARQLGVASADWIDSTVEFRVRLAGDRAEIADRFSAGVDPGPVVDAEWGCSDPHRGGRTVVLLRFESGLGLVYKPKGLSAEEALARFIKWLNIRGFEPGLATLRILDRPDYGWVERVEQKPVPDLAAADRYYERAGALLALMRALDGSDCHLENVVAAGEQPYLVDAETILQPRLRRADEAEDAQVLAGRTIAEGVLGVGLLPAWFSRPRAAGSVDMSGLGRISDGATPRTGLVWEGLGTDLARRVSKDLPPYPTRHELRLGGITVCCEDHEAALVRGYTRAHDIMVSARDELLGDGGLLGEMRAATVRVVLRGTWLYHTAIRAAQTPELLREGVDRSMTYERMFRPLIGAPDAAVMWPAIRSERRALEASDVPIFQTAVESTELAACGGVIPLDGSAIANAASQLQALDPADLERQTTFIRAALAIRRRAPDLPARRRENIPSADPLAGARRAGSVLRDGAIHGEDGGATWIGAVYNPTSERFELRPVGHDLYEGLPGIALFLSALARVDGPQWRDLARAVLRTVLAPLEQSPSGVARAIGIGGGGAGGLVASLTWCAALLGDASLLDHARALTEAIGPAEVAADERVDLLGGSAGLVLGLMILYEATGDEAVLERSRWGGERLLELLEPAPVGAAWRTLRGQPRLLGMAHGASGGALALARLAAVTGDDRYTDAARKALGFEGAHRASGRPGWRDPRATDGNRGEPITTWCYGSAGIGLARLALLHEGVLPDLTSELEQDIASSAASATRSWPVCDHLCCGAAGIAEFARSLRGRSPGLQQQVDDWAGSAAGRLVANEPLTFIGPPISAVPYPGLYQGVTGTAYALLGLVDPELPMPLAWS